MSPPQPRDLDGITVMVIEDDFYLAFETERALREAGAEVVGPHGESHAALRSLAEWSPSCAIVDLNLGSGPLFGIASALRDKNVPFLFLTAYSPSSVPPELADAPLLQKPVSLERIVEAAARLVGR
jgi:DNA-binding response OmpR family regulator